MNLQNHLNHAQLCDLVIESPLQAPDPALDAARDHLRGCYTCSATLAELNGSLDLFHTVAHTVAEREFAVTRIGSGARAAFAAAKRSPQPAFRWMQPLSFALAAALIVVTAVPLTLNHRHAAPAPHTNPAATATAPVAADAAVNATSDEALLEDVDKDLSASIPDSMQPLADPTATTSTANTASTQRPN